MEIHLLKEGPPVAHYKDEVSQLWDENCQRHPDDRMVGTWPILVHDFAKANALVDCLLERGYEVDYECLKEKQ